MNPNTQQMSQLDELLAMIQKCSPLEEAEFAHEHLQEARTYLLGAMPQEFHLSLELAKESIARLNDTPSRRTATAILSGITANSPGPWKVRTEAPSF